MKILETYRIVAKNFKHVAFHNAVTLVNSIFLAVSLLLLVFKEAHEALFLIIVLTLNIVIGIVQDLRAKVALEQLQLLMAPKITRINPDKTEHIITLEDINVSDALKISLGDQIPADGQIVERNGLEVNEALLTGESKNIHKYQNDFVLAGSIVTAGSATARVTRLPKESMVAQMTEKIKQYTLNLSPIQRTLNTFIKYMTYLLLAIVIYVVVHGLTVHELVVAIVKDIAALTGTLVPQGLILATTIFFAYGAIKLFRKQVLLQEINATEKLGRIKNLCIDKTGTLTENKPALESVVVCDVQDLTLVNRLMDGYVAANQDSSETTKAILSGRQPNFYGAVLDSLPFSSSRKYGAAALQMGSDTHVITVGAPDTLLPRMGSERQREWLANQINTYAPQAKRLVLLAKNESAAALTLTEQSVLSPMALFILSNPLRPGTKDIIGFFQNKGVRIRVISGDNPQTVQAVANLAGIKHADMIITGPEMEHWDDEEYEERVPAYHLYARIQPEQKEKIVSLLKHNGFTAMIGDGANDALAIKKADLGIAMFDGAGATRQIAQVVLMNNSFAALPTGVDLAETIITNIELVASVFFNSVTIGLVLFFVLAILGYTYPLSPRNTTIINYFIIWLPMVYWGVFPAREKGIHADQSFLRSVLPFSLLNGALISLAAVTVFLLGPNALKNSGSNIFVILILIALGYWFFVLTPLAYGLSISKIQRRVLWFLASLGVVFLLLAFLQPSWSVFFDLQRPQLIPLLQTLGAAIVFGWLQYKITKRWFGKRR